MRTTSFRPFALVVLFAVFFATLFSGAQPVRAAGVPTAGISAPAEVFIGEDFSFTVTFNNTGDTTGYGPFIDLVIPRTGVDGDDGIIFNGATYLGAPVILQEFTFDADGCIAHPYARDNTNTPLQVCGTPGATLVTILLPFGSFTPDQPTAEVTVNATLSPLADLNTPLVMRARAGFQFGLDALDNPCCDPTVINPASPNSPTWSASASVRPILYTLTKTYLGPEDETATGPNFSRQYQVFVDVAAGQTITNLDLTDVLPNTLQFVQVDSTTVNGAPVVAAAVATPSTTVPGGTLTRRFASVTGTTGADDASMLFTFYVPRLDAASAVVINPTSGDDATSLNNASASASWTPLDPRDAPTTSSVNGVGPEHTLTDKSIAIQKGVANLTDAANTPGDVLEYRLEIQISDFFAFRDIVVVDTFSDGQRFVPGFTPTLQVNGHSFTLPAADFNAANYTVALNADNNPATPATDGTTTVTFRLSNELITRGQNGNLVGGCVSPAGAGLTTPCTAVGAAGDGPTTATIVFRTQIQDEFSDSFPSGDRSVDQGDTLSNDVTVTGAVLDNTGLTPTGQTEADTSSADIEIARGDLQKSVYAVNGSTTFTTPIEVAPGDTITYRIEYTLPSSDVEALTLTDYLPLPVFAAAEVTTFNAAVPSAAAPPAGAAKYGPTDTFSQLPLTPDPTLSTQAADNLVVFSYGSYDNNSNVPSKVDLLFTVTVSDAPFADRLFLTNQVRQTESSTGNVASFADSIVQITLTQPILRLSKGVIGSNAPTATLSAPAGPTAFSAPGTAGNRFTGTISSTDLEATPIDANIQGVDAGDLVSFALMIENRGTSNKGAFDIAITDTLPTGFLIPPAGAGLNLRVTNGAGEVINFTGNPADLFTTGIQLIDPGAGACQVYHPDNGRNIIIITYDLQVDTNAPAGSVLTNTATVTNYAGNEGGPNHVPDPAAQPTDDASVAILAPMAKSLVSTSEAHTTGSNLAVGEIARFRLVAQFPEGVTPSFALRDNLPNGLTFLNDGTARVAFVSDTGMSSSTLSGGGLNITGSAPAAPTFTVPGSAIGGGPFGTGADVTFNLGTLTNPDNDTNFEYVVVEFNALVDNSAAGSNDNAETRANTVTARTGTTDIATSDPVTVTIVEPQITVNKTIVTPADSLGDAGDTITYRIVATNSSPVAAFDVVINDPIPAQLTLNLGSVTLTPAGGATGVVNTSVAGTVGATVTSLPAGASVQIDYTVTVNTGVTAGQQITNTAVATFTSLPGTNGTTVNATGSSTPGASGSDTGERTGSQTPAQNDHRTTDPATLTVFTPAPVKTLVTTSEAHTANTDVAVGEIARYRLAVRLAESTAPTFQLVDTLPSGLTFLNDGTARVAFVANEAGITSSTLTTGLPGCANLNVVGAAADLAGLPSGSITCPLPAAAISGGPFVTGTDVTFSLGNLDNNDTDTDEEYVVVEFNALVDNSVAGSNDAGDTRNNTFAVWINGTQSGSPAANVPVRVLEPSITNVNKTAAPTTGDAGDTVTFTVTYTNASGATRSTAYDVRLLDTLPAGLTLNPASVNVTLGGGATGTTNNSAGNTVDITITAVPPGGTVNITYAATLTGAVAPAQAVTNTANVTYTSLPGPNGTTVNATGSSTPGAPGSDTGERTGSGGQNDHADSDPATVTVNSIAAAKSLVATSEAHTSGTNVAVGEVLRYRLAAQLPEGTATNVQLLDTLPVGLTYLEGTARAAFIANGVGISSSTLSGAGLTITGNAPVAPTFVVPSGAVSGGPFVSGTDVTFSLGNLVNADSDADAEFVVIEFDALVDNSVAGSNDTGDTRANTFQARVNGANNGSPSANVTTTVVEPNLSLAKTVAYGTPPLAVGSAFTYDITINNTGTADAFDLRVTDPLPAGQTLVGVAIQTNPGGVTLTNNSVGNSVDAALNRLNAGATVVLRVTAQLSALTATVDQTNTATVTFTSLPGARGTADATPGASGTNTGERTGTGGINDHTTNGGTPFQLGSLGDRVWLDRNGNGAQDAGEPGLVGVTVELLDGANAVIAATTTGANGVYGFSGLPAGTYSVRVDTTTLPANLAPTFDLDGIATAHVAAAPLAAAQNRTDVDFGYNGTLSLGDRVWFDSNADGVQDVGEPGLPGVDITVLWAGPDGDFATVADNLTFTTTTGANGIYTVSNLPGGSYRVSVDSADLPDGTLQTFDLDETASANQATLTLTADRTDVDFGYTGFGSIGDQVWFDRDADGVQDAGEPGLPNVDITVRWAGPDGVFGNADDLVFTDVTDADGTYLVENLPFGNYRVSVDSADLPAGMTPTYDLDGTATAHVADAALTPAQPNRTDVDFGYTGLGSLGDRIWLDLNNDGLQDPAEPGIPGVDVTVRWAGPNGTFGDADDVVFTDVTDANGNYLVERLPYGDYQVTVDTADLPAGVTPSFDLDGIATAHTADAALSAAQPNRTDVDFGYAGTGSLGDYVWFDRNNDGVQDADEPGLAGVTLTLRSFGFDGIEGTADDITIGTAVTDANGGYLFSNLPAGGYRVTVDTATLPGTFTQTYDLDGTSTAHTATATLAAAENRTDVDFGYVGAGSIGDYVWLDRNGDGVQDADEPGLSGVTVDLTWAGRDGVLGTADDRSFTTTTDANGGYLFTGLPNGRYSVAVDETTTPAGTSITTANNPLTVDLGVGENFRTADFGYRGVGSIGDLVWYDLNADGVFQIGEPGFAGVDVTLEWAGPDGVLGTADDRSFTTTTDAKGGAYLFDGLPYGNYRVTVDSADLPAGFAPTFDLDGTATPHVTLAELTVAAPDRRDADFGYTGSGSIGDYVWFDENADGVQDAGEPGLPNISVTLTWAGPDGMLGTADDLTLTTLTDPSGAYLFDNLPAGDFTVTVNTLGLPTGVTPTFDRDGIATPNTIQVTLGVGEDVTDADFGYDGDGSLGDRVWYDADADGVQDAGEPGIAGVTVTLTGAGADNTFGTADDFTATTTTDANGFYLFENVPQGNYRVVVSGAPLGGLDQTFDLDGTLDATAEATLGALENRRDVDFGFVDPTPPATGSIGDRLWIDTNGNGIQDNGEPGLACAVNLIGAGPDGLFGTADDTTATVTADTNGNYQFTDLPAGLYRVIVDGSCAALANLSPTFELDGTLNGLVEVGLAEGETRSDVDFGFRSLTSGGVTACLGDTVWTDANGNGVQDAGETGIAGVTVTLTGAGPDGVFGTADDTTASVITDANGRYTFCGLPQGRYRVEVSGTPLAGLNPTYDLDGGLDNRSEVLLSAGQTRLEVDFGFRATPVTPGLGSIGDRLWLDLNSNSEQDADEPGLAGVTVTLRGPNGLTYSQVTDANGNYLFTGLPIGNYTVTIETATLPAGLVQTYERDETFNGAVSVELVDGEERRDVDFGYVGVGSIGDYVWFDADADRVQDAGEFGIQGVTVTLTGAGQDGVFGTADDLSLTVATDDGGGYRFTGLPAGAYRVAVSGVGLNATPTPTFELDGTLDGVTTVSLGAGQQRGDVDFGFTAGVNPNNASVGDRLWLDLNDDGVQDADEPGLPGVTVRLIAAGTDGVFGTADDVINLTTTGANGLYLFEGLPAGTYRVEVDGATLPAGVGQTYERDETFNGAVSLELAVGEAIRDIDFGYVGVGSLGDTVWFDVDADGVQDAGEPGIPGVTVALTWFGPDGLPGTSDDVTLTTTTDASGNYSFTGLPVGSYSVALSSGLPGGTRPTFDLDGTPDNRTVAGLTIGTPARVDVDFAVTGTSSISQFVWNDADADGLRDTGEAGIPGVVVIVTWAGFDGIPGTPDDIVYTVTTDSQGRYSVPNLPAGTYTVRIDITTVPNEWQASFDVDGGNDSVAEITLGVGEDRTDVNFGYGPSPTAVTLVSFTANRTGAQSVLVRWTTAGELNTWGFHVLRSATGDRADAERITATLIPGQGRNGGASYEWLDVTVEPGVTYTYWLEETELDGATRIYGPATTAGPTDTGAFRIYLPFATR